MIERGDIGGAAKVAVPYLLASVAWILLSDRMVDRFATPEIATAIQTAKGLAFVGLTTILLLVLVAIQLGRRRRASEELADRKAMLERTERLTGLGSWEVDLKRERLDWSDEVFRIFGISREELGGSEEGFFARVHPDDREELRAARAGFLEGKGDLDAVHRILRPDGEVRWVHERARLEVDADGEPIRMTGTVQDVTERRQMEHDLRDAHARLETALDASPLATVMLDEDLRVSEWNPAAEELFGWSREEVLGEPLPTVPEDKRDEFLRNVTATLQSQTPRALEITRMRKDGSRVRVELWAGAWHDAAGALAGIVGLFLDLTERKETERRLQEQADRLTSLSQRLLDAQEQERRAVAGELHDQIGQTLTLAHLAVQRVQRDGLSHDGLAEAADAIAETLERVRSLSLDLRPALLDDLGLIAALRTLVDRQARATEREVRFEATATEAVVPERLRAPLYRVAQEAITNAVRHGKARSIRVRLDREDDRLVLSVRDDGRGFDPEASLERARQGHSLGILGMRERTVLAGGLLSIRSSSGRGAEIRASFPLDADDSAAPTP